MRPTGINVVSTSRSSLNLTWIAPDNSGLIDHYEVEVDANPVFVGGCAGSDDDNCTVTDIYHLYSYPSVPSTVDSFSLTGLVSGQDYFVRIRACALSYVNHTDYVCSAWAYNGFPDSPIGGSTADS